MLPDVITLIPLRDPWVPSSPGSCKETWSERRCGVGWSGHRLADCEQGIFFRSLWGMSWIGDKWSRMFFYRLRPTLEWPILWADLGFCLSKGCVWSSNQQSSSILPSVKEPKCTGFQPFGSHLPKIDTWGFCQGSKLRLSCRLASNPRWVAS